MSTESFEKWEGLGNDFVVVWALSDAAWTPARAVKLCDRRFGIGADGVLLVLPGGQGRARMKVLNADGSVPEMCGNGLRCVARYVARQRGMTHGELVIETDAGLRACTLLDAGGEPVVKVDMGVVQVLGPKSVSLGGEVLEMTLADAGNPHAVLYRDDPAGDLEALGRPLATHAMFPKGTNVELVRWEDGILALHVWERGVGRTLACGTGACAVAAVACARGEVRSGEPVRVRLPGGDLVIVHEKASGRTEMTGPARLVFTGEWPTG